MYRTLVAENASGVYGQVVPGKPEAKARRRENLGWVLDIMKWVPRLMRACKVLKMDCHGREDWVE